MDTMTKQWYLSVDAKFIVGAPPGYKRATADIRNARDSAYRTIF